MLSRKNKRRIVLAVVLLLLLGIVGALYVNYRATRRLGIDLASTAGGVVTPPVFLYSFSGPANERLLQPVGVFADVNRVYVADASRGAVYVFNTPGQRIGKFDKGKLQIPLYIAKNPKTGNIYVTDRGTRTVNIFTPAGKSLGIFDPKLPKNQLPKIKTVVNSQWEPVAITFASDGTMYVTEILRGHRLLVFDPAGKFVASEGDLGVVQRSNEQPELFQFPNSVKVIGDEVWVADSNNRRMQVFGRDAKYKRILVTQGLPRGFAVLTKSPGQTSTTPKRFAVVDTLSQDVSIFDVAGNKLASFGGAGVLDGQFAYPTDLSVDDGGRIFVTDTQNGRVEVWGWPEIVAPIPVPRTLQQWGWCLSPLLLLPLLLLRRKRDFVVTADFVAAMNTAGDLDLMPGGRRRWVVWEGSFPEIEAMRAAGGDRVVDKVEFMPTPHSDADAKALAEKYELPLTTAAVLTMARRAKVFCTEDSEMRRMAKILEIDVVNREEFLERFAPKRSEERPAT